MKSRRFPLECDLVPYTTGFPPGRRWLFLAPHPDDELMGAGATLLEARRRGVDVRLVIVTDGGAQGDVATRESEAMAAANLLGLDPPSFWRFADRTLVPESRRLRSAIAGVLEELQPDVVWVTSPVDLHPDHRALALALQRTLRRRLLWGLRDRTPRWVAAYEIGTPMQPNLLVDASATWPRKREAAAVYASQLAFRPYDATMEALGTFRCLTLEGVSRAEAFFLLPARRVARLSAVSWAGLMGSVRGVCPVPTQANRGG